MLRWILAGLAVGAAIALKTCSKWSGCASETETKEKDINRPENGAEVQPSEKTVHESVNIQSKETEPEATGEPAPSHQSDLSSLERLTGLTHRQAEALDKAGYSDMAGLKMASDEELLAVSGIGPAALKKIRAI
jgi:DNA uptake protein ComE-like DNA-binding protein